MNELAISGNTDQPTMSSREIAELAGKKHQHVKRDIETMLGQLNEDVSNFGQTYTDSQNRRQTEYRLDRYHTEVLVTGYDTRRRAAVIKRWYELETGQATRQDDKPSWIKNLSPQARVAIEDLNNQVEHLAQEKERLNTVCNDLADNLREGLTPPQFCRMLNGVNTQKVQPLLVEWGRLIATRYGYRSPSQFRDRLFSERHIHRDGHTYEKVVLTQKGAKWLYSLYEQRQLPMKQDWDGTFTHALFEPGRARIMNTTEATA